VFGGQLVERLDRSARHPAGSVTTIVAKLGDAAIEFDGVRSHPDLMWSGLRRAPDSQL
jgi:hypothetical protein